MPLQHILCAAEIPINERHVEKLYDKAYDWLLAIGPRIVAAIIILFLGIWLIRLAKRRVNRVAAKKKVHSTVAPFLEGLVYTSLYVLLAFFIMQILGIQLTMFAALLAAFGAAAGLALSGTLQNFASGVLILLLKPFKPGDNIIAQGQEGTVGTIQIFYTIITTADNRTVIMPNSKLSNEVIINITQRGVRRLDVSFKFNYDQPIEKVKAVLQQAFVDYKETLNDPQARIGVSAMDQDGYTITCNVWVQAHGFEDVRLLINEKLIETLQKAGIKITH